MSALSNSWELSKRSLRVVAQDKQLLLFPLIAGLLGLGWIAALGWPLLTVVDRVDEGPQWVVLEWVLSFVWYLGLAFVGTVSKFCITYTTKQRFEGQHARFGESLRLAWTRLGQILLWSVARATIGLLLLVIDTIADSLGPIGKRVLRVTERLLGGLWEIVTMFVVPAMVYEGVAPVAAFKISTGLFKQTWGERLVRQFAFVRVEALCILGVFVAAAGLAFVLDVDYLTPIPIAVAVLGTLAVVLLFEVAGTVYDTALYVYATEQRTVGFDERHLSGAMLPHR